MPLTNPTDAINELERQFKKEMKIFVEYLVIIVNVDKKAQLVTRGIVNCRSKYLIQLYQK